MRLYLILYNVKKKNSIVYEKRDALIEHTSACAEIDIIDAVSDWNLNSV